MMKKIARFTFTVFFCFLNIGNADIEKYHLTKKVPLQGDDGWDYLAVDASEKRLYSDAGRASAVRACGPACRRSAAIPASLRHSVV